MHIVFLARQIYNTYKIFYLRTFQLLLFSFFLVVGVQWWSSQYLNKKASKKVKKGKNTSYPTVVATSA